MELFEMFTPMAFVLVVFGVFVGIIFGSIPGLTATMALAVFLPLTFGMDLGEGLALLIGLYVGGISGGMIPAALLKIPGTPSSVATTFDAYPMAQKGFAEKALKIGIVASVIGGIISLVVLYFFAPVLGTVAINFTPVEKFLIILFALTIIASISEKSMLSGIFSGMLGVFVSLIGVFPTNNELRMVPSFLEDYLWDGFSLLPVLIGLFGISEILRNSEQGLKTDKSKKVTLKKAKTDPEARFSLKAFNGQTVNTIRSSFIGTILGILPGVGGSAASLMSYSQAKNFSKQPQKLGEGSREGIIASEASNNGLTGGAMVPLLSLGIPGDSTTAVLLGAFVLQGIQVGPLFIGDNPDLWNGMIIALLFANIVMFLMMFTSIRYFARIIEIPKHVLFPIILVMCVVGSFAINNGVMFDVWTALIFGVLGFVFMKIGIQITTFLIGFILGRDLESNFLDSMQASGGDLFVFFTRSPIDWVLWALIIGSVVFGIMSNRKNSRSAPDAATDSAAV
ncbi:tripartite tricarboxylate transporter permease [Brevibacterium marinum]|uniref:Putative tricarboxylic transport membrane protein n=1 Tax=Brevibacterium marinum TaxID=418643 RepID=A0A846RNB3_9MICO|nr:tripartite tricarboxylate transporter permease [Brevibacterium marinum]NJC55374.1 putative tricarboxylic transport membrane protein [Brevibacterium marinum]